MVREEMLALNRGRMTLMANDTLVASNRGRMVLEIANTLVASDRGRMVLEVLGLSSLTEIKQSLAYRAVKRGFDIMVGLIGATLAAPVVLGAKIAYIISGDFSPVVFRQKRIGKGGKEFELFKIRSMVMDADKRLEEYLAANEEAREEYRVYKKLGDDPRITGVGKILRKFSLDEIPQFVNILRGEMSLIGNRPYLPREKEDMGLNYDLIVQVKPGLTGLWQVSGRSGVTFDNRVDIEAEYAKKASLKMDAKIFWRTFGVVLSREGV